MANNLLDTFMQEAEELLVSIEQSALTLSGGEASAETIHELFRAFHNLKGSGAMCGLDAVAGFSHHVETLLDRVREGTVPVTPKLAEAVLAARDQLKLLLAAEQGGESVAAGSTDQLIAMLAELSGARAPAGTPAAQPAAPVEQAREQVWTIRFRPGLDLFACGGNPILLFRDLRKLGPCEITAHTEKVPPLDQIQPDLCYLAWTVTLRTIADRNAIRDVFLFVEDQSELEIEPVEAAPSSAEPAPRVRKPAADGVSKALAKESTVRVPSGRLDRLVNLVGELVMNQSRLTQAASQVAAPELANPVQEIERLIAELRDDVLGIRMLPIGTLFGRFRRLVHDLSKELGKEVDLITQGAETELDKSILDQLGEPLVHLLRNSIDHGIETVAQRIERGKPQRGTIRLMAEHTGSDVVVSIEDDGGGIDREAVRARAIERQLIPADAHLNDKDVWNLLLLPGFSTARQVTNVSGRGVGMDVVKRQIDVLRGSLSISSKEGESTRISITLPLTLAIIDGLLVQLGRDQFIIPMAAITENVELHRAERLRNNGRNVVAVRGDLVPYIDLRQAFRVEGDAPPIEKIVIVRHEDQRVGIVVDRVLGTHQTVIQSLGRFFRGIKVVSGATIMGDGRVALILDICAVVRFADRQAQAEQEGTI